MKKEPKKKVEKLVLRKETLLLLEEGALQEVVGARSLTYGTDCCCDWH